MADRFTKKRREKRKIASRRLKIFMGVSIVVLLVVLGVLVFRQVSTLQNEANKIRNLVVAEDTLDTKIYTTGSFTEVEKTLKDYMNEYVTRLKEVTCILDDDAFSEMLSETNLQTDGPEFINSKSWIQERRELTEADFTRLKELTSKECIDQAIHNSGVSGAHAMLCEYYLSSLQKDFMHTQQEFEEANQQVLEKLDQKERVLEFLTENHDFWKCSEGTLTFDSPALREEYNTMVGTNANSTP